MAAIFAPPSGGSATSPYAAAAAGAAGGATLYAANARLNSSRRRADWALGIVAVLGVLEVVSSSDLNSDTTAAQNLATQAQAFPISLASTATVATLSTDVQNLRSHQILQDNLMANIAYHANIFAFTPPVQTNAPVQAGAITATTTTTQTSSNTAFVFLAVAALIILAIVWGGGS